jgi:hypothetical protein
MEYKAANLARAYGIPESTISRALKRGDLVKNSGGRIDDDNERNRKYLSEHRLKGAHAAPVASAETPLAEVQPAAPLPQTDIDLESRLAVYRQMQSMTIREAVTTYGSAEAMRDFISALRDMSAADEKDQKVRERRQGLIDKDFVVAHLFQFVSTLITQVLEYPESAVDVIIALIQAKGIAARNEVCERMEKGLSGIIVGAKEEITKELSGLTAKYQKENDNDEIKERLEVIEKAVVGENAA